MCMKLRCNWLGFFREKILFFYLRLECFFVFSFSPSFTTILRLFLRLALVSIVLLLAQYLVKVEVLGNVSGGANGRVSPERFPTQYPTFGCLHSMTEMKTPLYPAYPLSSTGPASSTSPTATSPNPGGIPVSSPGSKHPPDSRLSHHSSTIRSPHLTE